MKTTILSLAVLFLVAAACGQEKSNLAGRASPTDRAHAIAPYIDPEAFAVVRFDLARLNFDPLFDEFARLVPEGNETLAPVRAYLKGFASGLALAGAKEMYIVVTFQSPHPFPIDAFLVIPVESGRGEKAIRALFPYREDSKQRLGNCLVVAYPAAIKRLQTAPPDPRPELAAAFAAVGDMPIQGLLLPPSYTRRVWEETLPALPKELGGFPMRVITRGVRWGAIGIELPPRPEVRLLVQSDDAQVAEALRAHWKDVIGIVGQEEHVRKYVPQLAQLIPLPAPKSEGSRVVLTLQPQSPEMLKLLEALRPVAQRIDEQVRLERSKSNLHQIAVAMRQYVDVNKKFPAPASFGADGKPLLSWRVHILPDLGEKPLYRQFHLNEPWDSPHNRALAGQMPKVYRSPASKLKSSDKTNYLLPVGDGAGFASQRDAPTYAQISDGASNTILAVEANDEHAVVWTKPEDLPFDSRRPEKGLGGFYQDGFLAAFFDGWVYLLKLPQDRNNLRALFTRAAGDVGER
ncbi:MAG: DUF1559 domain-containing protein [Thermoguttaceae bacterium]